LERIPDAKRGIGVKGFRGLNPTNKINRL